MRIFTSFDNTGRRALVPESIDSGQFAQLVCHALLRQGAQCVLLTFRHDGPEISEVLEGSRYALRWAAREREIPGYLQLKRTLEETLSLVGSRTRNHLRYYRRRAEKDLGCEFVPEARISRDDFLALNRISSYPSTDEIAGWKYDSFQKLRRPVLCGLRDRDGRWLSLVGGLHTSRNMEIFWQINRHDKKPYSLGTVMRSFVIEHELQHGTRRLYFEGGTSHSMSHSFVQERCTDLFVMRDNLVARQIPAIFKRYVPKENPLNEFLANPTLRMEKQQTQLKLDTPSSTPKPGPVSLHVPPCARYMQSHRMFGESGFEPLRSAHAAARRTQGLKPLFYGYCGTGKAVP